MKPAKMRDHLKRLHSDERRYPKYFKMPRQKLRAQPNLNAFFNHLLALIVED